MQPGIGLKDAKSACCQLGGICHPVKPEGVVYHEWVGELAAILQGGMQRPKVDLRLQCGVGGDRAYPVQGRDPMRQPVADPAAPLVPLFTSGGGEERLKQFPTVLFVVRRRWICHLRRDLFKRII